MNFRVALIYMLAASSTAHADWQYTHWGMTVAQVSAAGGPSLQPPANKSDRPGANIELTGPYTTNQRQFDAAFFFDAKGLSMVMLSQRTAGECTQTFAALREKYGTPEASGEADPLLIWRDEAAGNRIEFRDLSAMHLPMSPGANPVACILSYAPAASTESGL